MSKIVSISEAASIGLHAMVLIAKSDDGNINANIISETTGASKNHISKVMQRLVKDGLVKSMRGPTGGFQLNKKPEEISMLDVYEAIEGKVKIDECPLGHKICPFNKCLVDGIIHKITSELAEYLKKHTLKDYL